MFRDCCRLLLFTLLLLPWAVAQKPFETESVAPQRFVAAHGRKAVVMGYASSGLEVWAYPLQLISGYEPGFRSAGETSEIPGATLLRRVTYEPQAITRTYIGPDFVVSERLFVPLNEQAVLLTYTVECRHSLEIVVHFTPVLDLMWPYATGGQNTHWSAADSAYIVSEATHRFSAFIGSPEIISHDDTQNSAQPGAPGKHLAFVVRAGGSTDHAATVVVARDDRGSIKPATRMADLLHAQSGLEADARNHYAGLRAGALRIETPDAAVNQQLDWADVALDQAWVCNPVLGCGLVAGYGPSRDARRPQYDWFFAGDALIAIEALASTGQYDRAREALAFIAKYQDASTGMIWHELSQSADPADWATRYPYMFVHVDITPQYLTEIDRYVAASGDTRFLQEHWQGIEAAYRYCQSLLTDKDGLPRIPSTKSGGDEQDRITDDLNLSVSWVAASAAFSRLAQLSGHGTEAEDASQASEKARRSAAEHYWDDGKDAWIDGYDALGRAVFRRSDSGISLVSAHLLDRRRSDSVLDQIAGSDFQTDWGTRGLAAGSVQYDPSKYSRGTVSAAGSAWIASAFWSEHRPETAFPIWKALLPWGTLDSMGHMHELLAGDYFHQQAESVPEQTWSSAAYLTATVHGLLGLEKDARANRLEFSPHLPVEWDGVSVANVAVSGGAVALELRRIPEGLELKTENTGGPVDLRFSPEIPFGAHLTGAVWDGRSVQVEEEDHPDDTHAALRFTVPRGKSLCLIRFEGGVQVSVDGPPPLVGESSRHTRITSISHRGRSLVLAVDVLGDTPMASIELRTSERPSRVRGAALHAVSGEVYRLDVTTPTSGVPGKYRHLEIVIDFSAAGNSTGKL
jgi:glycogen debranching enzyme